MQRFELKQRVSVVDTSRFASTAGQPAARWLQGRLGVVQRLGREQGAFVRMDGRLPQPLLGAFPHEHPLGRNILLFPWECAEAEDRSYTPFHHTDFVRSLGDAASSLERTCFSGEPACWFSDVTDELRASSETGLWERVYRFGVDKCRVTLLIYSSVSHHSGWSRDAGEDAIRFVYEVRWPRRIFLDAGLRINRSGSDPLARVSARVSGLMHPDAISALAGGGWTINPGGRPHSRSSKQQSPRPPGHRL